jgi:O-methyltransferase domain
MSNILDNWNLEKKKHLIRQVYAALPENGVFIALENIIDDDRKENVFGLMMSLNMLIQNGDACCEVLHLTDPCSAAIAYK